MTEACIQILDQTTAMKIAAGEVIERPSSAVRELIDNSLDANATWIQINAEKGGREFLSVQDNGQGMCEEDILNCYLNHATSKISHFDDLMSLQTFGFRGEALASLAEISLLKISSCTKNMESGFELQIEFGKKNNLIPKGMNTGTNITITDFFQNVPARLKFLGTDTREYRAIVQEFIKKAVSRPDVGFELIHNNEQKYLLEPSVDLIHRIQEIFPDLRDVLFPFIYEEEGIKVYGFLSEPSWYKSTRIYHYLFVNGRVIESNFFRQQISLSYKNLLPYSKFPAVFCYAEIDPQKIDFNVHPQKREIRFHDDKLVASIIRKALRIGLSNISYENHYETNNIEESNFQYNVNYKKENTLYSNNIKEQRSLNTSKKEDLTNLYESHLVRLTINEILLNARYIDTIFMKYLIFESGNNLYFIDFHAMHERIRYEKLLIQKNNILDSQNIIPIIFELSRYEADIFEEIELSLQKLGFYLSRISDMSFSIDAIPGILSDRNYETVLKELFSYNINQNLQDSKKWDDLCKMIACKGSVRAGDKLNESEIMKLLQEWQKYNSPPSCPHGRPIVIQMDVLEFDRRFKRTGF